VASRCLADEARRALAAYAGVLPLDNESADRDLGKHTGSHSNRCLRWILL
jgi:hypothetical protein